MNIKKSGSKKKKNILKKIITVLSHLTKTVVKLLGGAIPPLNLGEIDMTKKKYEKTKGIIERNNMGNVDDDMFELYKNLNLHQKALLFEILLFNDVSIFNYEHSSLDEACKVGHVCINGTQIQLTVHKESNIQPEEK